MRNPHYRPAGTLEWSTLDGLVLFAVIFTSLLKLPIAAFEGVPLWMLSIVPVAAMLGVVNDGRRGALLVATMAVFGMLALNIAITRLTFPEQGNLSRQLMSSAAAALGIGVIAASSADSRKLVRSFMLAIRLFLPLQLLLMLWQIATNAPVPFEDYAHYFLPINRHSGLLLEPSHVAVVMVVPLALLILFPRVWFREFGKTYLVLVLAILLLCPSATLLAIIALTVLARLVRVKSGFALLVVAALAAGYLAMAFAMQYRDDNPIAERVADLADLLISPEGQTDSLNVSAIAFAKSAYIVQQVLAGHPFGVGYDNFIGANTTYAPQFTTNYIDLNERDATSFALKFIAEMGWAGVALLVLVMVKFSSVMASRRRHLADKILASLGFCMLLAHSVRGGTYFFAGLLVPFALAFRFYFLARNKAPASIPAH